MSDNLMADAATSTKSQPIIEIRGLYTRFGDTVIHNGIDLDVGAGQILGLVGGLGSGNSLAFPGGALVGLPPGGAAGDEASLSPF